MLNDAEPHEAPLNMAMDEALLQTSHTGVLRIYRWARPAVSFGYFSRFDEAREFAAGREMVRRWTGGGMVPHGEDFTYSLIIPSADCACAISSKEIYSRVHAAIVSALRKAGANVELATRDQPRRSDACFANAVVADVLESGLKIAGAAHRRTRAGLLHQGSIQRPNLGGTFVRRFCGCLANACSAMTLNAAVMAQAEHLAREKYSSATWLRRR